MSKSGTSGLPVEFFEYTFEGDLDTNPLSELSESEDNESKSDAHSDVSPIDIANPDALSTHPTFFTNPHPLKNVDGTPKVFDSKAACVEYVKNHAKAARFTLQKQNNNKEKYIARCSNTKHLSDHLRCSFTVRCRPVQKGNHDGQWKILPTSDENHIPGCNNFYDGKRDVTYKVIGQELTSDLRAGAGFSLEYVKNIAKEKFHVQKLGQEKAFQAWEFAVDKLHGNRDSQWDMLQSYCVAYATANEGAVTDFDPKDATPDNPKQFKRLFISNPSACSAFDHFKPVIGLDACHLNGDHKGVLLFATISDPQDELDLLCWAIVDVENADNWGFFILNMLLSCPKLRDRNDMKVVILSDRDKGLKREVAAHLPFAHHVYCLRHAWGNVVEQVGYTNEKAHSLFFSCGHAHTKAKHDYLLEKLRKELPEAAAKLEELGVQHYAEFWFLENNVVRFGHVTSNLAESMNNIFKRARKLPILSMCKAITDHLISKRHDRYVFACNTKAAAEAAQTALPHPVANIKSKLEALCRTSARFTVVASSRYSGTCTDPETNRSYDVFLGRGWDHTKDNSNRCSCGVFQVKFKPCEHACRFIVGGASIGPSFGYEPLPLARYVHTQWYSYDKLQQCYQFPLHHAREDMIYPQGGSILAPDLKKGRKTCGRKRKDRMRSKWEFAPKMKF